MNDAMHDSSTISRVGMPKAVRGVCVAVLLISSAVLILGALKSGITWDEYVSNTLRPTFPDGLDVEVISESAISWIAENSRDPHEREHVTLGIYRRPEQFSLLNFESAPNLEKMRWTVDTPEDFSFVQSVYAKLYPRTPEFDLHDILDLLRGDSSIRPRFATDVARNAALVGLETGAMEHE